MLKWFFAFTLPLLGHAQQDDDCLGTQPLSKAIQEGMRTANKIFIKEADKIDVQSFCHESLKKDMADFSFGSTDEDLERIVKENAELQTMPYAITSIGEDGRWFDPWSGSLYPNEKTRAWNYEYFTHDDEWTNYLSPQLKSKADQDKLFAKFKTDNNKKQVSLQSFGACLTALPLKVKSCSKALSRLMEMAQENDGVMLPEIMKEVFNNPLYTKGAQKLASIIDAKIKKGGVPQSDLFSDTKAAFKSLGVKDKDLEEMSYKLMAIYGSRGPNLYPLSPYATKENAPFLAAMTNIGTGTVLLDSRSMKTGHPYSYPKAVKSTCDNGKPYHFWLSAYFSKVLTKEGFDPEVAATATFLAEMGYQMLSDTPGRDKTRIFRIPCFDEGNNKIRMDIAYASAGANFGAGTKVENLDVDKALKNMIKATNCQEVLTREEAQKKWEGWDQGLKGFNRWKHIIAPDEAMSSFKKK